MDLKASHPQTYLNVIAAGTSTALFIGSVSGHGFSGFLPSDGATVIVTNPQGQKRQFLLVQGKAVGSDQPESLTVQHRGDLSILTQGTDVERHEIPDALVMGG